MRAASVVPSFNGINVCSMTRTALGKVVTITGTLPFATITQPAQPTGAPSETPISSTRAGPVFLRARRLGRCRAFLVLGRRVAAGREDVFGQRARGRQRR